MVTVQKYHGTGNDFVIVDADEDVPDRRAFARRICDRTSGITHPSSPRTGADGVLFLALEGAYTPPRVVMTLLNPDGSVAAMCGNGARCAAAWARSRLDIDNGPSEVMIDTPAGSRMALVDHPDVRVDMGEPRFAPAAVPVSADQPFLEQSVAGWTVSAVNTGVPHAVAIVEDVDAVDLASAGPSVRNADVFPDGANFTVASPRSDGGYDQRTYERGVEAETESCGTGAVAIAAVLHRTGQQAATDPIAIHPPGGRLDVTVGAGDATLAGPVEREFGDVDIDPPLVADG